ncbi:cbb3-type cytochrome c oxidase subunit I [Celeribacter sp.]|uniref:cbb3-type cytochrome c oxidase subunit I n=1 Tax=Celeribacter sp. TaxID=1890673 RepID=UPI003A8F490F
MVTTLSPSSWPLGSSACSYYFLPKRAATDLFHRLSILSFWGIVFFYIWAGSHHLHYRPAAMGADAGHDLSVMLLVALLGQRGNALTLNGAWHRSGRCHAALRDGARYSTDCRPSKARSWRCARSIRCRITRTGPWSRPCRRDGLGGADTFARSTLSFRCCGSARRCIPGSWWNGTSGSRWRAR